MQLGNVSNDSMARDLRVSEVPKLGDKELSELIDEWLVSLDYLVAQKQLKKAMVTAASLVQLVRGRTVALPAFPKLILLVVRLSGIYGNVRTQKEHLDLYFKIISTHASNSDLDKLLEFTLLFIIDYPELNTKLSRIKTKAAFRFSDSPRLSQINATNVKDLYSDASLSRTKLDVIDAFITLMREEKSETQRILLKSSLYGYLCMNPFSTRSATTEQVLRALQRVKDIETWSTELNYIINEEQGFYFRLSSVPASDAAIEVRQYSLVTKPRTLLNFIALNTYEGQVNRCVELLHRLVLTPFEKETIPELCSYVEGEIATVVSLGLAKNHSTLHFGKKEHLSASALTQLSPALRGITRGDFDFAEQFLSLRKNQIEDSTPDLDHLQQLIQASVSAINSYSSYTSLKNRHEISEYHLENSYSPEHASLIDHLLAPGISSLIETRKLLGSLDLVPDEDQSDHYSLAQEELRSVHRTYGSRNFLFMSISVLILKYEIKNFPLKGIDRIDSLFNLFRLVDFDNSAVISRMHIDKIHVASKLGNERVVADHSAKLASIALAEEDPHGYAVALKGQLDSIDKSSAATGKTGKLIGVSISWLAQYSAQLDYDTAIELKITVVRELIKIGDWERAEIQLEDLLSTPVEKVSSSRKRVIYKHVALVANKLGKFDAEADAWNELSRIDTSQNAIFYTLQETRARNLAIDNGPDVIDEAEPHEQL